MEVIKTLSYDFPKKLDDRLAAILSCVNAETKNITLALCLDEKPRTSSDLREQFARYVDEATDWVPMKGIFTGYSSASFVPIGAVAEELVKMKGRTNPVRYWRLTEAGLKYAQPIAAFALKWAVDKGISMYNYLGKTGSSGDTRSPYNTIALLEAIDSGITRICDLEEKGGLHSFRKCLYRCQESGLADVESASPDTTGWAKYRWIGKKGAKVEIPHYKFAGKAIAKALQSKEADYNELAKMTGYSSMTVAIVLGRMRRKNLVEPILFSSRGLTSSMKLTDRGEEFLNDFVGPIKKALMDRKKLPILEQFREDIDLAASYAQRGTRLYADVSPGLKKRPLEERTEEVKRIIRWYEKKLGRGARWKEIKDKLGINPDTYLKLLLDGHEVKKRKKGIAVYYKVVG